MFWGVNIVRGFSKGEERVRSKGGVFPRTLWIPCPDTLCWIRRTSPISCSLLTYRYWFLRSLLSCGRRPALCSTAYILCITCGSSCPLCSCISDSGAQDYGLLMHTSFAAEYAIADDGPIVVCFVTRVNSRSEGHLSPYRPSPGLWRHAGPFPLHWTCRGLEHETWQNGKLHCVSGRRLPLLICMMPTAHQKVRPDCIRLKQPHWNRH